MMHRRQLFVLFRTRFMAYCTMTHVCSYYYVHVHNVHSHCYTTLYIPAKCHARPPRTHAHRMHARTQYHAARLHDTCILLCNIIIYTTNNRYSLLPAYNSHHQQHIYTASCSNIYIIIMLLCHWLLCVIIYIYTTTYSVV